MSVGRATLAPDVGGRYARRLGRAFVAGLAAMALVVAACRTGAGAPRESAQGPCPAGDPLAGVYHPSRLEVLGTCVRYAGTVRDMRHESDGDWHLYVIPGPGMERFLDERSRGYGDLIVELLPGQQLPLPNPGQAVEFVGTWNYDTEHDWNEIHPVWAERIGGGRLVVAPPPVPPRYSGSSTA